MSIDRSRAATAYCRPSQSLSHVRGDWWKTGPDPRFETPWTRSAGLEFTQFADCWVRRTVRCLQCLLQAGSFYQVSTVFLGRGLQRAASSLERLWCARTVDGGLSVKHFAKPARTRLMIGLFATAIASMGFSATAHAAYPGSNGRIAYDGRSGQIYTVNPDGTNLVNVSNNSFVEGNPRWTEDGRLVFNRIVSGAPVIYEMNGNGTNVKRLGSGTGDLAPDPSPSSVARIAFVHAGNIWNRNNQRDAQSHHRRDLGRCRLWRLIPNMVARRQEDRVQPIRQRRRRRRQRTRQRTYLLVLWTPATPTVGIFPSTGRPMVPRSCTTPMGSCGRCRPMGAPLLVAQKTSTTRRTHPTGRTSWTTTTGTS